MNALEIGGTDMLFELPCVQFLPVIITLRFLGDFHFLTFIDWLHFLLGVEGRLFAYYLGWIYSWLGVRARREKTLDAAVSGVWRGMRSVQPCVLQMPVGRQALMQSKHCSALQ